MVCIFVTQGGPSMIIESYHSNEKKLPPRRKDRRKGCKASVRRPPYGHPRPQTCQNSPSFARGFGTAKWLIYCGAGKEVKRTVFVHAKRRLYGLYERSNRSYVGSGPLSPQQLGPGHCSKVAGSPCSPSTDPRVPYRTTQPSN